MTRKSLKKRLMLVLALCLTFIIVGILLYFFNEAAFQTFRDFILLLIAIPATLLADYFQKRNNFEDALRMLWSQILHSVTAARHYTYRTETSEDQYREILLNLSRSIDEVRGVYRNLGESRTELGSYPFDSLKFIYKAFKEVGFGKLEKEKADSARLEIDHYWRTFKDAFLWEFDRPEPELFDTSNNYGKAGNNTFKLYKP